MEKERKSKKIILIILLILLIGLSIGFAAFNSNLRIQSAASVTPDPNSFKVVFSTSSTSSVEGTPVLGGVANGGTLKKDSTIISDLSANFTAPGQTATWKFYSFNSGIYNAFLNKVTLGTISCIANEGTDTNKVAEAAKGINIKVSVGGNEFTSTSENIDLHTLAKETGEEIIVTLTYAEGSALVDGSFDVVIGDIILGYDSVD